MTFASKILLGMMMALALGSAANAAVLFSLSPSTGVTPPGGLPNAACDNGTLSCLIFSGTITPDPGGDTFLNSIDISFTPPAGDLSNILLFFFNNVPGFLASADSPYTGPLFALDVSSLIAPGTYFGTAALLGGADIGDNNVLALAQFQVEVPGGVPEPASWMLMGSALGALGAARFRMTRQ